MKKVVFTEVVHTIGGWALPYLVNGDASGLEDGEQQTVDDWLATATRPFVDDSGQRWEFAHESVDTDSRNEFGVDEITGLRGEVYTVKLLFKQVKQVKQIRRDRIDKVLEQITCKTCKHFKTTDFCKGFGDCALTGDCNKGMRDDTRAYGWDAGSYSAGVYVGENFGCIHWMQKGESK